MNKRDYQENDQRIQNLMDLLSFKMDGLQNWTVIGNQIKWIFSYLKLRLLNPLILNLLNM